MASAEKLLHEARYAFNSISFGQSRDNRRRRSRARALCRKIIRRHPDSIQAGEAEAILKRLGESAYAPGRKPQNRHQSNPSRQTKPPQTVPRQAESPDPGDNEALDWRALAGFVFRLPKAVLVVFVMLAIFLFFLFGPLLLFVLVFLVFLSGRFRRKLKSKNRQEFNLIINRVNAFLAEKARQ